ncbi:hypothetical protein I4U23_028337 [Adineta vaga]|nr:hypothetical protein I4U23_028337 [Adineta vaga]
MTSPVQSKNKSRSITRHASKSPKRKYSPARVQTSNEFELEESAYLDPLDSSRTLLSNVLFERRDRNTLSSQATDLFNSQVIFEEETERAWLLENMHSTTISIKVNNLLFTVNGNYALKENQPTILFLHGFGAGRNWANWIKLAYPLDQRGRYSTIFIDLPGFGRSSGRTLDQTSWKRYGPEIFIAVLSSFHLQHSVYVIAQCGGAATTVRTINRYPQWFRNRNLVLYNSVIGDFGEAKIGVMKTSIKSFEFFLFFLRISK